MKQSKEKPILPEENSPIAPHSDSIKMRKFTLSKRKKWMLFGLILVVILSGFGLVAPHYLFPQRSPEAIKTVVKPASAVNYLTVVSTSPMDGTSGDGSNPTIKITFNKPVQPDSLRGYFTVSPMIPGTFTQGSTSNEVDFKAKFPFGEGVAVNVILNKGLRSISGTVLQSDYTFSFATPVLDQTVSFLDGGIFARLTNTQNGQSKSFDLVLGDGVSPQGTITVYKGSVDTLLSDLVYTSQPNPGSSYVSKEYKQPGIDTTKMVKVSTVQGLSNKNPFVFKEGQGLYYIEASSEGKTVGSMWVNVNDEGLIVRQDDQQVVVAAQNIKTGETLNNIQVSAYSLQDKPTLINTSTVNSVGAIPAVYPQSVDLVVGKDANGIILAPVATPETQADTRVTSNLSTLGAIYIATDRPTYSGSDTAHFSGVLRLDNDAQYTLPSLGDQVRVWVPDPKNPDKNLIDQTVNVSAHGIFSGSFIVPASLVPQGNDKNTSVTIYAQEIKNNQTSSFTHYYTTFDVVPTNQNSGSIIVSFDKGEFVKNDKIVAHVAGADASGKPLTNSPITYTVYAKNYDESDPTSVANFGMEWGEPVASASSSVKLDNQGHTDISIPLPASSDVSSQEVTVEASAQVNGTMVNGAKTILVHQGNAYFTFGTSRQSFTSGDTTVSRVYLSDLNGKPIANTKVSYEIYTSIYTLSADNYTENTLYQGEVTTDTNGFAQINQPVTTDQYSVTLRVMASDSQGNSVVAERPITILKEDDSPSANLYFHQLSLTNLDVSTDKLKYSVGDTANMTIQSPVDQQVLITYERGRIYSQEWVHLKQGTNQYSIPLDAKLSPSFSVVFSYFYKGNLMIEGFPLTVSNSGTITNVTITSDKSSYTKGDTATLTINAKNSNGDPVPDNVIIDIVDNNIFALRDTLPSGSALWSFYHPRDVTTNASSSTLGIGTGGGCGGGSGIDITYVPNTLGSTLYWNTDITTDENGTATIQVPLKDIGKWKVLVTGVTDASSIGQAQSILNVQ